MANVHAAIKQIRKDAKRRFHNQAVLSELKTLAKRLTEEGPKDPRQAESLARLVISKWDHAARSGVIPKQRADRKKARIAHFLTSLFRPAAK